MLEQNFSAHMKNKHNSSETRDASQMPITFKFQPKPNKAPRIDPASADMELEKEKDDNSQAQAQGNESTTMILGDGEPLEADEEPLEVDEEIQGQIYPNDDGFLEQECSSTNKITPVVSHDLLDSEKELKTEVASLRTDVSELKESVEVLKQELQKSRNEKSRSLLLPQLEHVDDETLLRKCKSVEDIMKYFQDLEMVEDGCKLVCRVCIPEKEMPTASGNALPPGGIFLLSESIDDGDSEILSRAFRNLKVSISRHLKRDFHQQAISNDEAKNAKAEKEAHRNQKIALHIGSACYKLYYRGRPYTDLEDELLLLHTCEVDIGDINHSYKFAKNYLESVAEVVKVKIQGFLKMRLLQTGFLPPVKVFAD